MCKAIEVLCCFDCPHHEYRDRIDGKAFIFCGPMDRQSCYPDDIPEWCPLPDQADPVKLHNIEKRNEMLGEALADLTSAEAEAREELRVTNIRLGQARAARDAAVSAIKLFWETANHDKVGVDEKELSEIIDRGCELENELANLREKLYELPRRYAEEFLVDDIIGGRLSQVHSWLCGYVKST